MQAKINAFVGRGGRRRHPARRQRRRVIGAGSGRVGGLEAQRPASPRDPPVDELRARRQGDVPDQLGLRRRIGFERALHLDERERPADVDVHAVHPRPGRRGDGEQGGEGEGSVHAASGNL